MGVEVIDEIDDDDVTFSNMKKSLDRRYNRRLKQEFSSLSEQIGEEQSSSSWSRKANRFQSNKKQYQEKLS